MTDEETKQTILFVGEKSVSDAIRCHLPASALSSLDYKVMYMPLDFRDLNQQIPIDPDVDVVIFSRPHTDTLLHAYKRYGIPVIVDMDDDFHTIPESHPGYNYVGPGNPTFMMKLENCMYAADMLVVTTKELQTRMSRFNDNITIIPNGWSAANHRWQLKRREWKDKVIVGWGGTITHREDFQVVVPVLRKMLKQYDNTMISIAGDPEIYQIFSSSSAIPKDRAIFYPMFPYDFYPNILRNWDIMLAPLNDDEFNRAKSDIKLVDAGAKGIPFVASDMPVYQDWKKGGFLAKTKEEWETHLFRLIEDEDLRKEVGKEGKRLAKSREMSKLVDSWEKIILKLYNERETR